MELVGQTPMDRATRNSLVTQHASEWRGRPKPRDGPLIEMYVGDPATLNERRETPHMTRPVGA
jgi:hypothetical protein